jgi:hypothetical protein
MPLAHSHFIPKARQVRGADRLMADLLTAAEPGAATSPQPNAAPTAPPEGPGASGAPLQVLMKTPLSTRSHPRPTRT